MGSLLEKALSQKNTRQSQASAVYVVPLDELLEIVEAFINGQVTALAFAHAIDPKPKGNAKVDRFGNGNARANTVFIKAIKRLYVEGYTLGGRK